MLHEQQLQLEQTAKTSLKDELCLNKPDARDGRNQTGLGAQLSFNLNLEKLNTSSF
jgi:hypothetical protein